MRLPDGTIAVDIQRGGRAETWMRYGTVRVTIHGPAADVANAAMRIDRAMRRRSIPMFDMTDVALAQQYFEAP